MNSWSPLSDGIVDSSIWEEPDHVFRIFIGMLSIKGSGDVIMLDSYKLHRRFHMPHELVLDALKVLSSPDRKRGGQPHDGRRIAAMEGGWLILNGAEYRERARKIAKRARDARAQANWRAKKAGKPLPYPSAKKVRVERPATEEEIAEAHAEVRDTTKRKAEADASNLSAVQKLNEIQSWAEAASGNPIIDPEAPINERDFAEPEAAAGDGGESEGAQTEHPDGERSERD